jgi:uncharacterized protein (TIGR02246 family)
MSSAFRSLVSMNLNLTCLLLLSWLPGTAVSSHHRPAHAVPRGLTTAGATAPGQALLSAAPLTGPVEPRALAGRLGVSVAGSPAAADNAAGVPESASREIASVNADWVPAMMAADPPRIVEGFARHVIWIAADGTVTVGRDAFEASMHRRFARGFKVVGGYVQQLGTRYVKGQVIEWGHSMLITVDAAGKRRETGGFYLTVWRRNSNGRWKVVRNLSL